MKTDKLYDRMDDFLKYGLWASFALAVLACAMQVFAIVHVMIIAERFNAPNAETQKK